MGQSRIKNTSRNFIYACILQIVKIAVVFGVRIVFVYKLGEEYLGVNGLFTNVIGILSLADLGMTTTLMYSLYKPLAENDETKIRIYINYFRKVYYIIALMITIVGIAIIPFLKYLVNLPSEMPNIYLYYILLLANSVISYLFVYKTTLLSADQKMYLINKYDIIFQFIMALLQVCYKEVSFSIEGQGAYSRLKFESGVHRVQRVPETESSGRIHTSAVTVAVLPEVEEVEVEINQNDLRIDVFRAGGPGGQCVNTTDSAVRITHIPTGIVVSCQDERSQHKNKDKAMKILRSRIYDVMEEQRHKEIAGERKSQVGSGDRSERIRTYNFPQSRVTDHRINLTLYKLEQILDGNLDEIIDALVTADQAAKLAGQND